ncbi:MAG: hypothetical protein ABJ239_07195 [Erythrobacter sp.]
MEIFAFTLIAVMLTSLVGKDARVVADLSAKLGAGPGLYSVSALSAIATAGAMAWLGAEFSSWLIGAARGYLIAGALLAAAAMLLTPVELTLPREPTRSHGAIGLVLLARQIIDAPRLLIFAAAAAKAEALAPFLAGGLGSIIILLWAVAAARPLGSTRRMVFLRRSMALCLGALAIAAIMIAHAPIA